jgi:hypothetical protein
MLKTYYTYIVDGDIPLSDNTPYLYNTRKECIEDLLNGFRCLEFPEEEKDRTEETKREWETLRKNVFAAFETGDTFDYDGTGFKYVLLECRTEE